MEISDKVLNWWEKLGRRGRNKILKKYYGKEKHFILIPFNVLEIFINENVPKETLDKL